MTNADGSASKTFGLTGAEFVTFDELWSTINLAGQIRNGSLYYDQLEAGAFGTEFVANSPGSPTRSLDYFTKFSCGAVDSSDADYPVQECDAYLLSPDASSFADGRPTFIEDSFVRIYLISAVATTNARALTYTEMYMDGATTLVAFGAAFAATIISLF